jgi:hypothetical protein
MDPAGDLSFLEPIDDLPISTSVRNEPKQFSSKRVYVTRYLERMQNAFGLKQRMGLKTIYNSIEQALLAQRTNYFLTISNATLTRQHKDVLSEGAVMHFCPG